MTQHEKHLDHIAAMAINAIDHNEVELSAEECAVCRVHYETFSEAAGFLASETITNPPFALRNETLSKAFATRAPIASTIPSSSSTPVDAYIASIEALDIVLRHMSNKLWSKQATEVWNIQELVTHLRVVDSLATNLLDGSPKAALTRSMDIEPMTRDAIAKIDRTNPKKTYETWRAQCATLINTARANLDRTVTYFGAPMPADAVVTDRAFETWIHTQDIRKALGLQFKAPAKADLRVMSDLGARLLPLAVQDMAHKQEGAARLVLTGDAGGTWHVPTRPTDIAVAPTATLTMDPLDFCLFIGSRLTRAELKVDIQGDESLASLVLDAAPMLSRI